MIFCGRGRKGSNKIARDSAKIQVQMVIVNTLQLCHVSPVVLIIPSTDPEQGDGQNDQLWGFAWLVSWENKGM